MQLIPLLIQDFNIYKANASEEKLLGVSGEVTLPTIAFKTLDISGPGLSGDMAVAIYGATEKMEIEIPYRALTKDMFNMLIPNETTSLSLRGAVQNTDIATQATEFTGVKIEISGQAYELNPGKLQKENEMGSVVKLTLSRLAIYLDDECVFNNDKLNNVLEINGQDILKKIRDLC